MAASWLEAKTAFIGRVGRDSFGDYLRRCLMELVKLDSLAQLTVPELERILAFANKAAGITTSRHGAIPAMPALAEMGE